MLDLMHPRPTGFKGIVALGVTQSLDEAVHPLGLGLGLMQAAGDYV
jgi:hypothetical protein